jgi:hypothetical protein
MPNGEGKREERAGADLRQGDILRLTPIGSAGLGVGLDPDETHLVAVMSQTCDALQASKEFCLVAPILENPAASDIAAARTGRKPLLAHLDDSGHSGPWIADLGRAFSVSKAQLATASRAARCVESASSLQARILGARFGRAYSRFPFPNEVQPVFADVQSHLRGKAGKTGNLSKVIDLVEDIRVSADQWALPCRSLRLVLIVPSRLLIPADDIDPNWTWQRIHGVRSEEAPGELAIDRVCELLLANLERDDLSTVAHLWSEFERSLYRKLIEPKLNVEVVSVQVEVVSDEDFTFRDFLDSESLDLETISDSAGA